MFFILLCITGSSGTSRHTRGCRASRTPGTVWTTRHSRHFCKGKWLKDQKVWSWFWSIILKELSENTYVINSEWRQAATYLVLCKLLWLVVFSSRAPGSLLLCVFCFICFTPQPTTNWQALPELTCTVYVKAGGKIFTWCCTFVFFLIDRIKSMPWKCKF